MQIRCGAPNLDGLMSRFACTNFSSSVINNHNFSSPTCIAITVLVEYTERNNDIEEFYSTTHWI
jgi:hypothetical protein